MTGEGLNYAKSWGVGNVYNVFGYHTNESKAEYKIFPSIKLINEGILLIQSNLLTDFIDGIMVRILGLQRKTNQARRDAFQLLVPMRFWGLWHFD